MARANEVTVVVRSYESHDVEWWADFMTECIRYFGVDAEVTEVELEEV